ncbi:MAG: DUF134 domain-containing protein [Deltaproteobacteria bacterium]|nr:DUF134 domain-containing protein [Deltaproteobacteria bacterium]
MPRPCCSRRIQNTPESTYFKPQAIPAARLREIRLAVDELEAIRLADLEGLYHESAAAAMNVSRATFGRVLFSARRKVAEALVRGCALRIEGGKFHMAQRRSFLCDNCGHDWQAAFGTGRPTACPECGGKNWHRTDAGPHHDEDHEHHHHEHGGHGRGRRHGLGKNRRHHEHGGIRVLKEGEKA